VHVDFLAQIVDHFVKRVGLSAPMFRWAYLVNDAKSMPRNRRIEGNHNIRYQSFTRRSRRQNLTAGRTKVAITVELND
jgi:hypothetical protein